MCAQYGRWNFDGAPTPVAYLEKVRELIAPCGPDGEALCCSPGLDILYRSFETAEPPCPELPPKLLPSGEVLTWEGRLDNRADLAAELDLPSSPEVRDLIIVAAAWERWGLDCPARLAGDWALTVWSPRERTLVLAADILATRHLYYAVRPDNAIWSSICDPVILLSEDRPALDEEYLAGWIASFPAAHLTAFRGVCRVPPACWVVIRPGNCVVRRYWEPDGRRRVRFSGDGEYEEQFLGLFRQSVRRRLRSAWPVLAELSGGIDSSSIVCVADRVAAESAGSSLVDTVSYYSDDEPDWNERPWFERVEAQRGKSGLHLNVNVEARPDDGRERFPARPGAASGRSGAIDYMIRMGHRVLLSGTGGDEFLGGVPTPLPELEDLLARGKLKSLASRIMEWALIQRRPWIHLLRDTAAGFLPPAVRFRSGRRQPPLWLTHGFARRQRLPLSGYKGRLHLSGPLPSFQENLDALDAIRRQLACSDLIPGYPIEKRYPCLDRDLLEFLFSIPREQLVRPGERRSLMRRSLRVIVPDEVLHRRRKAFVSRAPLRTIGHLFGTVSSAGSRLLLAELDMVDPTAFRAAVSAALQGLEPAALPLMRALVLEHWLRALDKRGTLDRQAFVVQQRASMADARREFVGGLSTLRLRGESSWPL